MSFSFTGDDIKKISEFLDAEPESSNQAWTWRLKNNDTGQALVLTVHNDINLGTSSKGSLISVQTQHGYFEIHDAVGYMLFEPDEIIFVQSTADKVSCMITGKSCACSMYTNINRAVLSSDFTELDPPVLLAAMQLSLTEAILA